MKRAAWFGPPSHAGTILALAPRVQLRVFQSEALARLRGPAPAHVLCLAPTGSGKSLIYERIAAEKGRRTLLITPLVALARQQAERLSALGIPVVIYPGSQPKPAAPRGTGIWILSPESLQHARVFARLASWRPDFLVVDECHCLYDWGDRFRQAFLDVPPLIRRLGIRRSLWLTATLPRDAQAELERSIGAPLARIGKFALPPNLRLSCPRAPWVHRAGFLLERVAAEREPGIIFVNTREATARVSRLLSGLGRRAVSYHAGLSQEERRLIETDLREADLGKTSQAVLVATSAFGMGMDYAHFRWCALWQPPASLLALAQAIGRIGRNPGLEARASVFWDEEDFRTLQWMTWGSERKIQALRDVRSYLMRSGCRTRGLETFFNEEEPGADPFCEKCDICSESIKLKII